MKNIKFLLTFLAAAVASKAQLLTGWGTGEFTLGYNDGSFSQNASAVTWSGSDFGMILRGTFTPVSIATTPTSLILELTFNSTFSGQIDITIGSSAGNVIGYNALLTNATGTSMLEFVRDVNLDSGTVNLSAVNRVAITSTSPNFTLNTLTASAIPEPSTAAALGGLAILGFAAARRQRRSA